MLYFFVIILFGENSFINNFNRLRQRRRVILNDMEVNASRKIDRNPLMCKALKTINYFFDLLTSTAYLFV